MPIDYTANLGALDRWKNDLAMRVRRKVFRQFWRAMKPTRYMRVADFGVSGHRDHPAHFFFETLYPWKDQLTAIGREAENVGWMPDQFPVLTFLEADLREIPLPDNYFDIGICNAVVEHAGTYDQQVALVHEVCRVSKKVMFTTPNKDFPVEVHTFVPLASGSQCASGTNVCTSTGKSLFGVVNITLRLTRQTSWTSAFC